LRVRMELERDLVLREQRPRLLEPPAAELGIVARIPRVCMRGTGDVAKAEPREQARHRERILRRARTVVDPPQEMAVEVHLLVRGLDFHSSSSVVGTKARSSSSRNRSGTRYSSPSHLPRSTSRQRLEQKGKSGFVSRVST